MQAYISKGIFKSSLTEDSVGSCLLIRKLKCKPEGNLLSYSFVIGLLRENLFLVLGNITVVYSSVFKKGSLISYFISAKIILSLYAMLVGLSLFIFIRTPSFQAVFTRLLWLVSLEVSSGNEIYPMFSIWRRSSWK